MDLQNFFIDSNVCPEERFTDTNFLLADPSYFVECNKIL